MQITVDKNKNGKVVIKAKASKDDVLHAKKHALSHLGEHITAPGFRKGKAPTHIVEELVKTDKLVEEILSHVSEDAYIQALNEHKIVPISRPSVNIPSLKDVKTQEEATKVLWPDITKNGVEIEITTFVMPEIDLGKWKDVVKKVKLEEPKKEAKKTKTKKGKNDDEKSQEKQEEKVQKTPEQLERELEDKMIEALVNRIKFEIADELIEGEADQMIYRQAETVQKLGINYEDYLKMQNKSWEDVRTETKVEAEKVVRARFIISEIAKELEGELGDDPKIQDVIDYLKKLNKGEEKTSVKSAAKEKKSAKKPSKTTKKAEK